MQIYDVLKLFYTGSNGTINFHIFDEDSYDSSDEVMSMADALELLENSDRKAYPFAALLDCIYYIDGKLTFDGYL